MISFSLTFHPTLTPNSRPLSIPRAFLLQRKVPGTLLYCNDYQWLWDFKVLSSGIWAEGKVQSHGESPNTITHNTHTHSAGLGILPILSKFCLLPTVGMKNR